MSKQEYITRDEMKLVLERLTVKYAREAYDNEANAAKYAIASDLLQELFGTPENDVKLLLKHGARPFEREDVRVVRYYEANARLRADIRVDGHEALAWWQSGDDNIEPQWVYRYVT